MRRTLERSGVLVGLLLLGVVLSLPAAAHAAEPDVDAKPPGGLLNAVTGVLEGATDAPAKPIGDLATVVESVTKVAKPVVDPVAGIIEPVTTSVKPVVDPVLEPVTELVNPVLEPVTELVSPVLEPVTELVNPVLEPVTELVSPVLEPVTDLVSPVKPVTDLVIPGDEGDDGSDDPPIPPPTDDGGDDPPDTPGDDESGDDTPIDDRTDPPVRRTPPRPDPDRDRIVDPPPGQRVGGDDRRSADRVDLSRLSAPGPTRPTALVAAASVARGPGSGDLTPVSQTMSSGFSAGAAAAHVPPPAISTTAVSHGAPAGGIGGGSSGSAFISAIAALEPPASGIARLVESGSHPPGPGRQPDVSPD